MRKRWAAFLLAICSAAAGDLKPPVGFQPVPELPDNPLHPDKIKLGERLFGDVLLSADRTVSCATCHRREHGFTIPERFGRGIGGATTTRRPATLLNRAYGGAQFWDGRAASLEDLALQPIQHPQEMGLSLDEMQRRLASDAAYSADFKRLFGRPVNPPDVGRALSAFLRSIVSEPSPYTRFLAGDARALSAAALRGMELFYNKARCNSCHWDPNFTDEAFHSTGIAARQAVFDAGRANGTFKTPTLHNVSRRPPFMHDGSFASLEDVVAYYDGGGQPHPRSEIRPIGLTAEEKADLVEFLKSL